MSRRLRRLENAPRSSRGAFLVPFHPRTVAALLIALGAMLIGGCAGAPLAARPHAELPGSAAFAREEPFVIRTFRPFSAGRWIGNGVAYGPHRDGQRPGGPSPTRQELREDLRLMTQSWNLLRVYQAVGTAESLLAVIREDRVDMKVMLGAWIDVEERRDSSGSVLASFPETRAANRREVATAIRLARTYPDIVLAVCVGNETQVFWSGHRVPPALLIDYIREVRAGTTVPVTTADDFNFWNKMESRAVAREVDFVVAHMHPMWNGLALADAVEWTKTTLAGIRSAHPDRTVILGETGWATRKHSVGEQATLIKGQPGESEQKGFFEALNAWVEGAQVTTFFFEAFDENWKGGSHPDEVEKHWGLFRSDRTPKPALGGDPAP